LYNFFVFHRVLLFVLVHHPPRHCCHFKSSQERPKFKPWR
jgi:hypothetical protein